ncbi:MAG: hypothetical protein ACFCU8_19200 [Thermosynechococcaceae cyanobacterium]
MKIVNRAQGQDRILPVDEAKPILEAMFGPGWSRWSVNRKIKNGEPFTWVQGRHYFKSGSHLRATVYTQVLLDWV